MTTARDFCAAVNPPMTIVIVAVVGEKWREKDLALLTQIRTDNPSLSQRGFARFVLCSFPGRTFNGVYHKVRILDLALAAAMGDIVATEIG